MKNNKSYLIFSLLTIAIFTACSVVDPMASEQYQKDIYIIGANERISSFDIPYGNEQETFFSISASGSQKVDRDVVVTLKHNDEIINWYNSKYMLDAPVKYRHIESEFLNIPSWTATLKAGELYTHFPFKVNTSGLHCDSLYCIGFAIKSVSDYQMSESGAELIFTLKLINQFSGNYHLDATKTLLKKETLPNGTTQWVEQGAPLTISVQRTLTASSENTVRFFHERIKENLADYSSSWNPGKDYFNAIKNSCIQFVKTDGNKFTVEAWEDFEIVEGEAEYDDGIFTFRYDYMEGSNRYRMKGVFRK